MSIILVIKNETSFSEDIRKFIGSGDIEKAAEILVENLKKSSPTFRDQALLLQSRINSCNTDFIKGLMTPTEKEVEFNKIKKAMLDLLQQIDNQGK